VGLYAAGDPDRLVNNDAMRTFQVTITLSGEQNDDAPHNENHITAAVTATLTSVEGNWPMKEDFVIYNICTTDE